MQTTEQKSSEAVPSDDELVQMQREHAFEQMREMSDDEAFCPTCGNDFDSIRAVLYHHNHKHNFELYKEVRCEYCDELFEQDKRERKYCDATCFGLDKHVERIEVDCINCGDVIELTEREYEIRVSKTSVDGIFCSSVCGNSGEFSQHWKGGSDEIRKSPEYRQWKKAIHQSRDDCKECGETENLQAHHIVPIAENEDLATDVSNGVLLCASCHSDEHPDVPDELFMKADGVETFK